MAIARVIFHASRLMHAMVVYAVRGPFRLVEANSYIFQHCPGQLYKRSGSLFSLEACAHPAPNHFGARCLILRLITTPFSLL